MSRAFAASLHAELSGASRDTTISNEEFDTSFRQNNSVRAHSLFVNLKEIETILIEC